MTAFHRLTLGVVSLVLIGAFAALELLAPPRGVARAGDKPEAPTGQALIPASEEEVGKLVAAMDKARADKDDELLLQILFDLARYEHADLVPLIQECMKSKDITVLAAATRCAALHDVEGFEKDLLKLVKRKKQKSKRGDDNAAPELLAASIGYLAVRDVKGAEEVVLEDHLPAIFIKEQNMSARWAPEMMRAGTHYLGAMKHKPAAGWLIAQLPEPQPADPNSASNPPASYWEARYKLWQASEGWVRWALLEITGQEFRTDREWEAWFKLNEKEYK